MNRFTSLPAAVLAGALAFAVSAARAGEGHDHAGHGRHDHGKQAHAGHGHGAHEHQPPDTTGPAMGAREGLATLRKHLGEMERELVAAEPGGFHAHEEAVQAAVRGLDRDSSLSADRKKRVQGYVKNVRKLVHKIHHAAEEKRFEPARKELAKLKTQVDLLEKQFAATAPAPARPASAPAAP